MSGALAASVALLLGVAAAVWPPAAAASRLRVLAPGTGRTSTRGGSRRPPMPLAVAAAVALVAAAAGPGGAVAAMIVVAAVARTRRARRREAETVVVTSGLADGLCAFAAELRAGHPPATAADAAGRDAEPACARALALVAATARLGGDVPAALRGHAAADVAGPHLSGFVDAWALADRYGIGLAGLAEAAAEDLRARTRFRAGLAAALAGPRTTAAVLAGLPLVGLVLGHLIGADPWRVLTGSPLGQVLLVTGAVFAGAGLEWSERLTARVVR